jgi:hypothetical protein
MSVTVVTEAFNLADGQSTAALKEAVRSIRELKATYPELEMVLVDPNPRTTEVSLHGPIKGFTYLPVPGMSYDDQKDAAVRSVTSDVVVFLDGDCRPADATWLPNILAPFANPEISAVGGVTVYDDFSLTGKAMSVMDWGFLFVEDGAQLGCYASNNVAFRRDAWLSCPPSGQPELRCNCYAHAQELARREQRLVLRKDALVLHELPNVRKERLRRGYDLVAASWVNPRLMETAWINEQDTENRLIAQNLAWDEARLSAAPTVLGLDNDEARGQIWAEIKRLRNIDRLGIQAALDEGRRVGLNRKAFADFASLRRQMTDHS